MLQIFEVYHLHCVFLSILYTYTKFRDLIDHHVFSRTKRGSCSPAMASFDGHAFCARCRDKKKGTDTCVDSPTKDCKFCLLLSPEQKTQLATPLYKLKKEKRDAKKSELSSPSKDGTLVDPSTVAVIGAVSDKVSVSSPREFVTEKKVKKDKPSATKSKKTVEKSSDKKMVG